MFCKLHQKMCYIWGKNNKMEQYCPQCVVQLQKENKKLGILSKWMVCPRCGHRERPSCGGDGNYAADRIKNANKNLNKFNTYTENNF